MRTCGGCGGSFQVVHPQQRFCNTACRQRKIGRARRAKRGNTTQRGYGREHRRLRAQWQPVVDAGQAVCARCGRGIAPGAPWQLDHRDDDRTQYLGPSHRTCNLRAGAIKGNRERATPGVVSYRPRIV